MGRYRQCVAAVAAVSSLLSQAVLAQSTVTSGGSFNTYYGPVGFPVLLDGKGVATSYVTNFLDVATGALVQPTPQDPYPGYEDPKFGGSGTKLVSLPTTGSQGVEFWNTVGGVDDNRNLLRIDGTVTPGISIDPVTRKSQSFKLATITFTNGDWYATQPEIDPGNGPLYPQSVFAFSMFVTPDPFIGNSGFPGYHVLNDALVLVTTSGPGTPDYLYLGNNSGLGVIAVQEGMTGTVDVWGRIGSVELTEFRNPSAGVEIMASIPASPVPEPGVLAMLLAGLGLIGGVTARQRHAGRA